MSPLTAQALEALEARWAELNTYDDRPLSQQLMERGYIARHSPDPWPQDDQRRARVPRGGAGNPAPDDGSLCG